MEQVYAITSIYMYSHRNNLKTLEFFPGKKVMHSTILKSLNYFGTFSI